ncbi:uncharacterized protein LOC131597777 [Vicia villosa]|uniref:uncharacterized protein LOC131597777 n=1 Tax=Vicia villosa TaxID=3911 RepID=UPI00273BD374|nr:uncharacterized protein LOC131597777 [Vicia villosa]
MVFMCFRDFHSGALLSKSITSSFLALIPKNNNPLGLDEYRPICLVGSIHKIISKVLAERLKKVIGKVISSSQSAFVPGRQLLDGVVVANELVDYATKAKSEVLLFKVDFEKAYDKVNWEFLRAMMSTMGFGDRWLRWMKAIVFSSHMSVMVNGSTTKEFKVEKGLRQGDPISPFLFVIVAEGLKGLVNRAVENGDFKGFNFKRRCFIDVLKFSDDTILIGDGSWSHLWAIKSVLRAFEMVSGLGINFHKSKLIGINISDNFLEIAANFLGCRREGKEFTFLGLPIGSNPRRMGAFGGEDQKTDSKRCIHWIKWNKVCLPIEKGGLGIRRLADFNQALLVKWKWRIVDYKDSLWYGVLKARYGDINLCVAHGGALRKGEETSSHWWRDIVSLEPKDFFITNCFFSVGNGSTTSFWHSNWNSRGILKDAYPLLYSLSSLKDVSVDLMGCSRDDSWRWGDFGLGSFLPASQQSSLEQNSPGLGQQLSTSTQGGISATYASLLSVQVRSLPDMEAASFVASLVDSLRLDLQGISLDPFREDRAVWKLEDEGIFTVRSCYASFGLAHLPYGMEGEFDKVFSLVWRMDVPLKTRAFGWRCFHDRIPTRGALYRKGIIPPPPSNSFCAFCHSTEERSGHLFLSCQCADLVWRDIVEWVGFVNYKAEDIKDSFLRWFNFGRRVRVRKGKEDLVWLAVVWHIWLVRNEIVLEARLGTF